MVKKLTVIKEAYIQKIRLIMEGLSFRGSLRCNLYGSVPRGTHTNRVDLDYFVYYMEENFDFVRFRQQFEQYCQYVGIEGQLMEKHRGLKYIHFKVQGPFALKIDVIPHMVKEGYQKSNTELAHIYLMGQYDKQTYDRRTLVIDAKNTLRRLGLLDADAKTKGFSGYCVENLILKYGSLNNVPDDLTYFQDPVVKFRNLLASISTENLRRFNVFKHRNFRGPRYAGPVENLYLIRDATLKTHTHLKKDRNVVCAVVVSGSILVELRDYYVFHNLSYDNNIWDQGKNQQVYCSGIKALKKYKLEGIFEKLPLLKFQKVSSLHDAEKLQKTYCFFR